jgi:hypothetical protein
MNNKNVLALSFVIPVLALVSGCGGGGGSDSGSVVTVPPTPPSPPTPPPAPPPSAATKFSTVAVGALLSRVVIDNNGNGQLGDFGDSATPTTLSGDFGRDVAIANANQIFGTLPISPLHRMQALGIDATTGFVFGEMTAPIGATVVSPISTLIDAQGSENTVRTALGLTVGTAALRTETNLLTFNPVEGLRSSNANVSEDAGRITSINIQLLALAAIAKDTNGDPIDVSVTLRESSKYLAEIINSTGGGRLADKSVILGVLRKSRSAVGLPDAGLDAAATLLAKYFSAIPSRINDESTARAWAYAYRFYVLAEAKVLLSQWPSPAAARIDAITTADIEASAQSFQTSASPVVADFMTTPGYRELIPFTITPYSLNLTGCSMSPWLPSCDDWRLFSGPDGLGTITSVVTGNAQELSVTLSPQGHVTLTRVGNFTGLSFFTYTVRSSDGLVATGTVYVRVKDRL